MTAIPFFFNQCLDKGRLKRLILWSLAYQGEYNTIQLIENLKTIGFQYATYAGVSLGIDDLRIPPKKADEVTEAEEFVAETSMAEYTGNGTKIETLQSVIDSWQRTSEAVKQHVIDYFEATNILNPVYMMAFSGARGNVSQVRQLVGLRGLMADAQGNIIGFPIQTNFREGLTVTEYMISCYGARKGVVDTALRTADAGYLTRRLVDVAQHVVVQKASCGTRRGISLQSLKDYGEVVLPLRERLVGRVFAADFVHQGTVLGRRNQPISEAMAFHLSKLVETNKQNEKPQPMRVRSPLTCELPEGVCQLCYGWSLSQSSLVTLGEAVGIIAGQSIGEPGTQLTMRTFHTGGVFTGGVDQKNEFRAPIPGVVAYPEPLHGEIVRTEYGRVGFLTKRPGALLLVFGTSRRGQLRLEVPTHTTLFVREGERVEENQLLGQLADGSSRRNERRQVRKILFSQLNGQVLYHNTRMAKTLLKDTPLDSYATPMRPKYRVSSNLGTIWVLAGDYLGATGDLLHMYRSSGHLVEPGAQTTRFGILGLHDGIVCLEASSHIPISALRTRYQLSPRAITCLSPNQEHSPQSQDSPGTKALYTPFFTGVFQSAGTCVRPGYTFIKTPTDDGFLINTSQLKSASFSTQLQATKLDDGIAPCWASAGKNGEVAITYFPSIFKTEGGGFFWREQYSTDATFNHGVIYWTSRMAYMRTSAVSDAQRCLGWGAAGVPHLQPPLHEPLALQFYSWALAQHALWGAQTLQNVTSAVHATTYGLVQYTGAVVSSPRADDLRSARPAVVPCMNPLAGRAAQQYDLRGLSQVWPTTTDFFQFPFAEGAQPLTTVQKVTVFPGWLYFPQPFIFNGGIAQSDINCSGTAQSFAPALMDVQTGRVRHVHRRPNQLFAKIYAGRANESTLNAAVDALNLLPSFRKIFALRHPELIQFLVISETSRFPEQAYQAAAQFYTFTHALSPWFYFVQPSRAARLTDSGTLPIFEDSALFMGWLYKSSRLASIEMQCCRIQTQSLQAVNFNALVRATFVVLNVKNTPYSFDQIAAARRQCTLAQSFEGTQIHHKVWTSVSSVWVKQVTTQLRPRPLDIWITCRLFFTPFRQLAAKPTYGVRFVSKTHISTGLAPATLTFSCLPGPNVGVSRMWSLGVAAIPSSATARSMLQGPPNTVRLAHDPIVTRARKLGATGETFVTAKNEVILLRSQDVKALTLPPAVIQKLRVSVGQVLRYGDELMPGLRTVVSGQIFAITTSHILVRRGQPILFYKTGALHVRHGQWINTGHPLVTLTQQRLVTGDIVQGIPKVEQVFEASQGRTVEVNLPYVLRHTFRALKRTMVLPKATRTSLEIIQHRIIDRIQKIYLSQGVTIADKHFEIIVRQMTSKVRVLYPGDTGLFRGEIMPIVRVEAINAGTMGRKARYAPIISGISATALTTDSFLSAASFQETTRVLTRDALSRKTDFLRGLKERVILGDLIPAGTGLAQTIVYRQSMVRDT